MKFKPSDLCHPPAANIPGASQPLQFSPPRGPCFSPLLPAPSVTAASLSEGFLISHQTAAILSSLASQAHLFPAPSQFFSDSVGRLTIQKILFDYITPSNGKKKTVFSSHCLQNKMLILSLHVGEGFGEGVFLTSQFQSIIGGCGVRRVEKDPKALCRVSGKDGQDHWPCPEAWDTHAVYRPPHLSACHPSISHSPFFTLRALQSSVLK